ncbi:MAG: hypothetical protein KGO81_10330 [Bacteroidota bacterium]|nr:hypothetical protein [Bacteroidota bacterium]
MNKTVIILYLVVFGTFVLFTRQPDYFDGEITSATIHWYKDSSATKPIPHAVFTIGKDQYACIADYIFRSLPEGKTVNVIYETAHPKQAAVYSWWGYWLTAGELVFSIVLIIVLYQIAVAVTKNPTPEAVLEQMEYQPEKKKKYVD